VVDVRPEAETSVLEKRKKRNRGVASESEV
jgi:hypothetical protein